MLGSAQKLVFFVGQARTSSSLLGSLLDAHPHVIVSNEYNMFSKLTATTTKLRLFKDLFALSNQQTVKGLRSPEEVYNHHVPGLWQGKILGHLEV